MKCMVCGGSDQKLKARVCEVDYVQCACGVTFPSPLPTLDEMKSLYEDSYTESMGSDGENPHFREDYQPIYRSEKAMTFVDLGFSYEEGEGKSWLDVGSANGLFVEWIAQFGYDAAGVDLSEEMVEEAKRKGLRCYASEPDELGELFDVVSLWDVIEHVPDPVGLIERCKKCLREGGSLFIQTPSTGIISDTFGADWRQYDYPNHIHLFSEEALCGLLKDKGFKIKKTVRFGSGNTSGTLPADKKKVFDTIAKKLGIGDELCLWATL